jgi:hypothetical protein
MGIRTGVWRTAGGSALKLIVENGKVSGQYSTVHGQPKPGREFPIIGMVNGDLIGFICSWNEHHSLTSWCGRYGVEDSRECIRTAWHLARVYADRAHKQENEYWETFTSYTGTYFLVSESVAP